MAHRRIALALAALALAAPRTARAQFRPSPMVIRLPWSQVDVVPGNFTGTSGDELLLVQQGLNQTELRPWRNVLRRDPSPFPASANVEGTFRGGYLPQNGGDALADVAAPMLYLGVGVVFGSEPGVMRSYALPPGPGFDSQVAFLRLLPRPQGVLVMPVCMSDTCAKVFAVDFDGAPLPTATSRSWVTLTSPTQYPALIGYNEAFPVRLSSAARSQGIDDVAATVFGGFFLLAHASPPTDLASIAFGPPVLVGGRFEPLGARPPWLPATVVRQGDVLGVASLDVNLDGFPDLVFTHATALGLNPPNGSLIWVEGTGNPADFANGANPPWRDLGLDPALGLVDPLVVRGLDLVGEAAVAVWDRAARDPARQEVVVAVPDASVAGGLRVWRAPAPAGRVTDIHLADVVGSPAPDLVLSATDPPNRDSLLVYPDTGDASPSLAWAAGSPGAPVRGVDHAMAVDSADADSPPPLVEWRIGDPDGVPVAQALAHVVLGASLCGLPPPDLTVFVRATDDLGVFTEVSATLPVAVLSPSIAISGASPGAPLVVPPGGTSVVLDGTASVACAPATWGGSWPSAATITDEPRPTGLRRTVVLPEAAYAELLAGPVVVTLSTPEAVPDPVATLNVALDATGLVDVRHESDRSALAEGEIAVLRTRVRSRLAVALPNVRVVDALAGLVPAGAPTVSGAAVVTTGAGGAEVILDALPPAPAEVAIDLPVVSSGGRAGSAVEVRSSGDHLLTPIAARVNADSDLPGCGCGSSSGGTGLLLVSAWIAVRAGVRRLRPRR